MAYPMPLVVPPRRAVTLGGQRFGRETLLEEMHTQSVADVRAMLRGITIEQTAQQIRLGNPPQLLEVDGRAGKRVDDVNRRTVVVFGVVLAASAMRQVEMELANAIAGSTTRRTGRLASVSGSWRWFHVPKGQAARPITAGSPPRSFGPGDELVLVPQDVPYATLVNRYVGRTGRLNKAPRRGREAPRSQQGKGFLFWAAANTGKRVAFRQFTVKVVFSRRHMVPGEVMTRTSGTGMIVIRARGRRVKV